MLCDAGAVFVDVSCQIKACVHQHGAGIDGAGLLVLIVRFGVEAAQALHAVTGLGLTHDDSSHHGFLFIRRNELPRAVEVVLGRGDEAVEIALADKAVIFAVVGDLLLYFGFFVIGELSGV